MHQDFLFILIWNECLCTVFIILVYFHCQVPVCWSSLNSSAAYVLHTATQDCMLWYGQVTNNARHFIWPETWRFYKQQDWISKLIFTNSHKSFSFFSTVEIWWIWKRIRQTNIGIHFSIEVEHCDLFHLQLLKSYELCRVY